MTAVFAFYPGAICRCVTDYADSILAVDIIWNLGWLAIPVLFFAVIGTVNGVNFTDGVDGLAVKRYHYGCNIFLRCSHWNACQGSHRSPVQLAGALLGFLLFNVYPASVFMGDTGSLALGGFVAATAYMLQMPIVYPDRGTDLSG